MTPRAIAWPAVSTKEQAEDDKASMEAQEREQLVFAEANQWRVVDILRVPGHSRSYIDYYEMAQDAAEADIPAFNQMLTHWKKRDFDVWMVRDGDRLAREQAPIHFMVSKTIEAGARIYSFQDGWVHPGNYRMVATMWAYRASTEVDQLKIKAKTGKEKNTLEKGIFTQGKVPFGFRQIRNDKGRIVETVIDETFRFIFEDVAAVVLDRVTWLNVESELHSRYGHINPRTGKPFTRMFFYHWLHNPWVWGHATQGYRRMDIEHGQRTNTWVIDDTLELHEGAVTVRNKRAAVYTGDLAEALKSELRRRHALVGGARQNTPYKFTGLCICGRCGFYMVHDKHNSKFSVYRCNSRRLARSRPGCTQYRFISEQQIIDWLDAQLRYMAEHKLPDLLARSSQSDAGDDQATRLRGQLVDVERDIATLIRRLAKASDDVADLYQAELDTLGQRRTALQKALSETDRQAKRNDMTSAIAGFAEYLAIGPDNFWQESSGRINQVLHRIFNHRRMVVLDNAVDHVSDAPPVSQPRHGKRQKRKHKTTPDLNRSE